MASKPQLPVGDPIARARVLAKIRDAVLTGGRAPVEPRAVVSDSWDRSLAVDITGPVRTFHPATLALVTTSARLAKAHLRTKLAERDEQARARNLAHLTGLADQPGALLTSSGRVLATQAAGWLPERLTLPASGDRIDLGHHGEAILEPLPEGFLLRVPQAGRSISVVALQFLAADRPVARIGGREVRLTLRHAELLTVLALHPGGLTAEQLATEIYGPRGNPVSVRAEVHRLRIQLGPALLSTQPYRLNARVHADFLEVRSALAAGRVADAADSYRGPLLPRSESPAIRAERQELLAILRRNILARSDTHAMWTLASTADGVHDAELSEHLLRALPLTDPRHAVVTARLDRIATDDGRS